MTFEKECTIEETLEYIKSLENAPPKKRSKFYSWRAYCEMIHQTKGVYRDSLEKELRKFLDNNRDGFVKELVEKNLATKQGKYSARMLKILLIL